MFSEVNNTFVLSLIVVFISFVFLVFETAFNVRFTTALSLSFNNVASTYRIASSIVSLQWFNKGCFYYKLCRKHCCEQLQSA